MAQEFSKRKPICQIVSNFWHVCKSLLTSEKQIIKYHWTSFPVNQYPSQFFMFIGYRTKQTTNICVQTNQCKDIGISYSIWREIILYLPFSFYDPSFQKGIQDTKSNLSTI